MKMEEEKDLTDVEEKTLLKEHSRALKAFVYIFIGATLCFAFWYTILSQGMVNSLFHSQSATISAINGQVVGMTGVTGNLTIL